MILGWPMNLYDSYEIDGCLVISQLHPMVSR